ncbi:hydroxymethylglutaryl-CoA lyase [Mycobacterium sp. AT1]|uniref:hydroxymethylglutaryl-CoA lyase n=1 Tax=Mycobacterium sp. AT1 TaxID=1961706 RepID=UPI0009AD6EFF|nr:hydroxymethylglutaryl-CoA lyase [Mycobacterium sp. AT1]OPX11917.1 hydroxymethylglutaryl-CoA lyase [Mycobacterium sp. AT1]
MNDTLTLCECFARDGLQHEPVFVPTATKLAVLDAVVDAGFVRIEASSYSNPRRVPALADVSTVMAGLTRRTGVSYKNTCPNPQAVLRAVHDDDAGIGPDEISLLLSASDSHSRRNLNASRADQWSKIAEMIALAQGRFTLVGVVSVAFGCPFEGAVDPGSVAADVARLVELGADYVSIGDTTGLATPPSVRSLFSRLQRENPDLPIIAHFHNTRGTGLANVVAALDAGIRHFDSALGGVGGHPADIQYGQGLTGNVCTEDLVNLVEAMGLDTGIDLDALMVASKLAETALDRPLHSMVARAGYSTIAAATHEVSHV